MSRVIWGKVSNIARISLNTADLKGLERKLLIFKCIHTQKMRFYSGFFLLLAINIFSFVILNRFAFC